MHFIIRIEKTWQKHSFYKLKHRAYQLKCMVLSIIGYGFSESKGKAL